ncbi:hypothetical protein [Erwinia sp. S38]|uniref:hypothetical protein n=1 Tax=Erwinia sp. S38 TaxID=2769338 RepID=UPI00190AAEF0|nr:hypothetical protein [Erwinia sp. S38]MBK0004110.1 hypothetical protein [Erwinia sp. S38]
MSLIRQRYPGWVVVVVVVVLLLCILWFGNMNKRQDFSCRAQLDMEPLVNQCGSRNLLNLFMAINGNGEGYLLLSGKLRCLGKDQTINDILDFDYEKEGRYYDLHLRKKNTVINKLLPQLRDEKIMIKISKLDRRRYLVSSDKHALLICTSE